MERKLASIQVVESLSPIEKADRIEVARVMGWNCVVKKGEFQTGDRCVYFEIDSLLPKDVPVFDFMAASHYRVKTVKLRGQISQGLAMPLSMFPWLAKKEVGDDVGKMIGSGVKKYEADVPVALRGVAKGNFPIFLKKTDEPRIQSSVGMLTRHAQELWYVTEKLDGTSFTAYYYEGQFGVCSRNLDLKEDPNNLHWQASNYHNMQESLPALCAQTGSMLAVQGEIIGPKIQGNKYGLESPKLFVFGVYDIKAGQYVDFGTMVNVAEVLGLETVPVIETDVYLGGVSVDNIVSMSEGESALAHIEREGLVYRTMEYRADHRHGHASFKAINNKFLLKHEDA